MAACAAASQPFPTSRVNRYITDLDDEPAPKHTDAPLLLCDCSFSEPVFVALYDIEKQIGHLANYFDYDAYARDLFMYDYYYDNGYVFRHY